MLHDTQSVDEDTLAQLRSVGTRVRKSTFFVPLNPSHPDPQLTTSCRVVLLRYILGVTEGFQRTVSVPAPSRGYVDVRMCAYEADGSRTGTARLFRHAQCLRQQS